MRKSPQRLQLRLRPRKKKKTDTLTQDPTDPEDDSEDPDEREDGDVAVPSPEGNTVYVRYRHSFMSRMIQSDDEIKGYYRDIKNKLLSYSGVKARMSWGFESFSVGRLQIAKMNIRGKALVVFFAIDPSELDAKYHVKDNSEKSRYSAVPSLFRVKSARSVKFACEIVDMIMNKNSIEQLEDQVCEEYDLEYRDTATLAREGYVKAIYSTDAVVDENTTVEQANVAEFIKK